MVNLFNGVAIPKPSTFDEDLTGYAGKSRATAEADNQIGRAEVGTDDPRSLEELAKDHYAGVKSNDEDVGLVLMELGRQGILDQTAIILSSDHGFFLGEHHFYDKRLMYEPSIRIPMIVRYPARVKAGGSSDKMALNLDVAATILDLAAVSTQMQTRGKSLMPIMEGKMVSDWRTDWLYEYYEYQCYVIYDIANKAFININARSVQIVYKLVDWCQGAPLDTTEEPVRQRQAVHPPSIQLST